MAWLYLPGLPDSSLESNPLSQTPEPFVMSRGKRLAPQSLSRKWKKAGWIRRLSGLTSSHSTVSRGAEKWISYLPDSPANRGPSQGSKKGSRMNVGCGATSSESLAKFDLDSSSWRTSQACLTGEPVPFSGRWPRSGSTVNGQLFARQKLAHHITATGFSSSPQGPKNGVLWPTPNARDWKDGETQGNRKSVNLGTAVHQATPWKICHCCSDYWCIKHQRHAHECECPPIEEWTASPYSTGGQLSPDWVEWLIGWPTGWTDCALSGTGSSPSKQVRLTDFSHSEGAA